jgi:hypothetical protein
VVEGGVGGGDGRPTVAAEMAGATTVGVGAACVRSELK